MNYQKVNEILKNLIFFRGSTRISAVDKKPSFYYLLYMKKIVFPGSFDPPTNGHFNLIQRATLIFDEVHVVIAINERKKSFFNAATRKELMLESTSDMQNVFVHVWDRLIVDFMKKIEAKVILRGVRALADFEYEFELAMTNKQLYPDIEILFMPTDPQFFVLRSSAIKEIASFGGDISKMVPENVSNAIKKLMNT